MNTMIEIHDNNTNETDTYKVWYKDREGKQGCKVFTYDEITTILTREQEEKLFFADRTKYRFKIQSEYDFIRMFIS